jgi:hypothetical protein
MNVQPHVLYQQLLIINQISRNQIKDYQTWHVTLRWGIITKDI